MKSLAAIRYSKDSLEEFELSERPGIRDAGPGVRSSLLANAVRISPEIFPSLARAVDAAVTKIEPAHQIECYVASNPEPNAQCIRVSGDHAAVVVTSGLVELLSESELPFVIGHEIGHHLFGHASYPVIHESMDDAERLRVLALRRAGEISADRMGFVCSPSLDDTFRGMLKVASGLSDRHLRLDVDAYLGQLRELESLSGHHEAVYDTHPMFPLRVRALLWFSMSEPYYYWTDDDRRPPISTEQLNEKVAEDFSAICGFGLDHLHSAALRSAKIWSMVKLATLDGRLTQREQRLLADALGREEADKAVRFVRGCGQGAPEAIEGKFRDALEAAAQVPEKERLELIEELERVASAAGGTDEQRLSVLHDVAQGLGLDREIEIRPWSFADGTR